MTDVHVDQAIATVAARASSLSLPDLLAAAKEARHTIQGRGDHFLAHVNYQEAERYAGLNDEVNARAHATKVLAVAELQRLDREEASHRTGASDRRA